MNDGTHRTIQLQDGRWLGYAEWGEPGGAPLFFFHGWPGSRLEGRLGDEAAREKGVRLIAQDAIKGHAIAWVSVMAFSMTAPMVAWMRHRGHAWSVCLEMTVAMVAPALPLCLLRAADLISGSVCGAYCGLSLVAMVGVMVYRRDYYSHRVQTG